MYDFLRKVPLFADLPERDLEALCRMVDEVKLPAGAVLFEEGSMGDQAYVIQEGQLEVIKHNNRQEVLLAVRGAGEVIGEMALLESIPRAATIRARTDTLLLAIHQDQLEQLLDTSASAARAMLHTVLARHAAMDVILRQSEKMAQLGTLTAGVAHELNNPAAAVKRGVDQLSQALAQYGQTQRTLSQLDLTPQQRQRLHTLEAEIEQHTSEPPSLSALERSDREYELEVWLEDQGVEDAWELAPALVNLNYTPQSLAPLAGEFSADQLPSLVTWLSATNTVYSLMQEIDQGASRISEIVKALKSYSYLDQAPIQEVDLHEGLDNTLVMLRSKLRDGITVRKEYDPEFPRISAYGSELNQVWTNILDNAADAICGSTGAGAVEGQGEIVIRTRRQGEEWVVVELEDNGPGIAPEIIAKVFDPFFTTKPPGKGTGLGLNISYNIVVEKHKGDIKVFSRPGHTVFQVWLPVNFDVAEGAPPALATVPRGNDERLRRILRDARTIAVVGSSHRPTRPAYTIPKYLHEQGYRIIAVNPRLAEKGEAPDWSAPAYPDLPSIPEPVDVVQIFRRAEDVPPIVEDAIAIGVKVVWMQSGIINEEAANTALAAGLEVVMDQCMMLTHRRLFGASSD